MFVSMGKTVFQRRSVGRHHDVEWGSCFYTLCETDLTPIFWGEWTIWKANSPAPTCLLSTESILGVALWPSATMQTLKSSDLRSMWRALDIPPARLHDDFRLLTCARQVLSRSHLANHRASELVRPLMAWQLLKLFIIPLSNMKRLWFMKKAKEVCVS